MFHVELSVVVNIKAGQVSILETIGKPLPKIVISRGPSNFRFAMDCPSNVSKELPPSPVSDSVGKMGGGCELSGLVVLSPGDRRMRLQGPGLGDLKRML